MSELATVLSFAGGIFVGAGLMLFLLVIAIATMIFWGDE